MDLGLSSHPEDVYNICTVADSREIWGRAQALARHWLIEFNAVVLRHWLTEFNVVVLRHWLIEFNAVVLRHWLIEFDVVVLSCSILRFLA